MTRFDFLRKESWPRLSSSMNQYLAITVIIGGVFLFPSISLAATLYAKQDGVKVTTEKAPSSAVITTLALGDSVTLLSEEGRLAKVKTSSGKTGWVFKFRLSEDKPSSGSGLGLSGLTGRKTLAARESRAGGSIRGLKESTEQYAKDKQIKQEHRDAVDRMEAFSVTTNEFTQFKKAGKLGEFSGGAQ
ncbi:MAG: SH3 domain-containing protein [Nitrospirota bacterium]|nr:SH3 domain-containing protein [Nitrospirota bacterium]MDH5588077.1 SH3 domain-containing protein [Nitrospirota bacterium]